MTGPTSPEPAEVLRRAAGTDETVVANRTWWDGQAEAYAAEHGRFLEGFRWGPEGWTEADLGLLGARPGEAVLEIGAGAAQCSRWLRDEVGARVVATDLSGAMLRRGALLDADSPSPVPLLQCDGAALPFADGSFARVFTAYGVFPFVADAGAVLAEVCRVLTPGGRLVFSTSHPLRWALPDVPGEAGLGVQGSYFDRTPYVEQDSQGHALYVEHHRTIEDWVALVRDAGLVLTDLREPTWPGWNEQTWGGWSPLRGRLVPGTLIVGAERPA